jgi:hypothetical protein
VADTLPPVLLCQNDTTYLDAQGMATISPSDVNSASTDNCAVATTVASPLSFSCSDVGANTVIVTVTDSSGNPANCTVTVMVVDSTAPTTVCQNVFVMLDGNGQASITASDIDGGSGDICGIASMMASPSSFSCGEAGANSVTLTVSDSSGNSSTCIATVTVSDTTPPIAVCQDITAYLDASGNATITAADVDGGSRDNCSIQRDTISPSSFSCLDIGMNSVSLTVFDQTNRFDACTATVTVQDSTPPTAGCQNATVYVDTSGNASISLGDVENGSTDNCNIMSLAASPLGFNSSNLGMNNVTVSATDSSGNTGTCIAMVMVIDSFGATAICQDITVHLDASGNATITASDVDGGSTSFDGIASLTAGPLNFDCSNLGRNMVTLVVVDSTNDADTCTANVTVTDTTSPTAVCQDITVQLDASGNATITASDVDGGSNDNCAVASIAATPLSFDCQNIGANTVTLTATDSSGNSSSCTAAVTVFDTLPPIALCNDVTIYLDAVGSANTNMLDLNGGSNDNCGIALMGASKLSFVCSDLGANSVTMTFADTTGNTSSCTSTVTVIDSTAPTALCQSITAYLDASGNVSITASDVDDRSDDNCAIASISAMPSSFDCSNIGANSVNLTASDSSGNTSSCTATVTVADSTAPTAVCQNISTYLDASGNASITASGGDGGSRDNCSYTSLVATPLNFDCQTIGSNTVTLTVTDSSSNSSSCTATVTVFDTLPPIALCNDVTIYLDALGNASTNMLDLNAGSGDNFGIALMGASKLNFVCSDRGTNTVTMTYADTTGNTSSCTSTVTVIDSTAPTALCQSITAYLDASGNASITASDVDGGSSDNCSIANISAMPSSFDCSHIGANSVSLATTDSSGNTSSCTTIVTIADSISPTAVCQPATAYLDVSGNAHISASDVDGGSGDNCAVSIFTASPLSFDCSSLGQNTVVATVRDSSGNSSSCTTTVTVVDSTAPMAMCQAVTIYLDAGGNAITTMAAVDSGSSDNCVLASMNLSMTSFDCSHLGANSVSLHLTDSSGNTASCTATVTVLDSIAPVAVCRDVSLYFDSNGSRTVDPSEIDNGSADNCSVDSM